jgi:hypothetical protein
LRDAGTLGHLLLRQIEPVAPLTNVGRIALRSRISQIAA